MLNEMKPPAPIGDDLTALVPLNVNKNRVTDIVPCKFPKSVCFFLANWRFVVCY